VRYCGEPQLATQCARKTIVHVAAAADDFAHSRRDPCTHALCDEHTRVAVPRRWSGFGMNNELEFYAAVLRDVNIIGLSYQSSLDPTHFASGYDDCASRHDELMH
jgi:hypothetical protein